MKALDVARVALHGANLIEASAGTGKTYAIAMLFLRLVVERGLAVSEILVVTFTRAATAELRDRLRRRLVDALESLAGLDAGMPPRDALLAEYFGGRAAQREIDRRRLATALRDFDQAAVQTIHSFCMRVLEEGAFESRAPFDLEFVTGEEELLDSIVRDFWAEQAFAAPPAFVETAPRVGAGPEDLLGIGRLLSRLPEVSLWPEAALADWPTEAARCEMQRGELARIWSAERDAIVERLCDGNLSKTKAKPERVRTKWVAAIGDFLGRSELATPPEELEKLTPAWLSGATNKQKITPQHEFFERSAEFLGVWQGFESAVGGLRRHFADEARRRIEAAKQRRGLRSYSDLLTTLQRALDSERGADLVALLQRRYRAALIDEFQDTDPQQVRILGAAFGEGERALFQIGDPKQAIYAFRGADVHTYLEAAQRARKREGGAYTLATNYRSDPGLIRALNLLFGGARAPFGEESIEYRPVEGAPGATERLVAPDGRGALHFHFVRCSDENRDQSQGAKPRITTGWWREQVASLVADEIVALLASGARLREGERAEREREIGPGDLAVLCATKRQARRVQQELVRRGVPTVLEVDSSVYASEIADDLDRLLDAMLRPTHAAGVRAAAATRLIGLGAEDFVDSEAQEADATETASVLDVWFERFAAWGRCWHERGFAAAFHRMLDEAGIEERLLGQVGGQRALTDLLQLGELLQKLEAEERRGPLGLSRRFRAAREEGSLDEVAAENARLRLEHDERAVRIGTIHQSKGLEYPIVFCPFQCSPEAEKHYVRNVLVHESGPEGSKRRLDLSPDVDAFHREQAFAEGVAERMRLLYVALTRAKHRCHLVVGNCGGLRATPPALLLGARRDGAPDFFDRIDEAGEPAAVDALLRGAIEALVAESSGSISCSDLVAQPQREFRAAASAPPALTAREFRRVLPPRLHTASFSRLAAGAAERLSEPEHEGRDRDEASIDAPEFAAAEAVAPVTLADFPAGARTGTMLHWIFERVDFARSDVQELPRVVEQALGLFGFGGQAGVSAPLLVQAIADGLATPLAGDGEEFRLADVDRSDRLAEVEFVLPVADRDSALRPAQLAALFERHGASPLVRDYARRLADFGFDPLSGDLRGFVDLIFRRGERYYLLDYKSNRLGRFAQDYASAALGDAMCEHDYLLQYHLYALALERHLRLRLTDYSHERNFGGVFYLFVRGLAPHHPAGTGVYFDRPPQPLLAALSDLFRAPGAQP